jgi:hypothetical protein
VNQQAKCALVLKPLDK